MGIVITVSYLLIFFSFKFGILSNIIKKHSDKKGNSLFAEVDDQRQQMRDLLSRQKQQYQSVRIEYFK